MKTEIWKHLSDLGIQDYFITADFVSEDKEFPLQLDSFIFQKLEGIRTGRINGRKFSFKEGNWKIYLIFFPTNKVVDERFAMKNKMIKTRHNLSDR